MDDTTKISHELYALRQHTSCDNEKFVNDVISALYEMFPELTERAIENLNFGQFA